MPESPRTRYFVACPKGLEYLLAQEAAALGAVGVRESTAGVWAEGDDALGYRLCLWSRLASRVLRPVAEVPAGDTDELYDGVAQIDWSEHLAAGSTLAVTANGRTHGITNTHYARQVVKDAIVDQLRTDDGVRPSVARDEPDVRVDVLLRREHAIVAIDLAGSPLFHRGYRDEQGEAPLKENLAAAMLLRAGWPAIHAQGGWLVDPFCGSGTLPIEAALMGADVAPGLHRRYFGFLGWAGFDASIWTPLIEEARERARAGLERLQPVFVGSDIDPRALATARRNADAAGVGGAIRFEPRSAAELTPPAGATTGLVIANPPYGERLGDAATLRPTYAAFGRVLREHFPGWKAALLTNDEELAFATGLRADRRFTLFNGGLQCTLACFDAIDEGHAIKGRAARPYSDGETFLANRLRKTVRHLRSWREREGVSCWRAYDADLPEYAAAIDVYGEWLHIQEYPAPAEIPVETAERRLGELIRVAGNVFEVPPERISLKQRRPQGRRDKYERLAMRNEFIEVQEGGLRFLVNLFDYLDAGLFLDHRPTRARIRELARDRHVLNLFSYTGAATVYAAAGGARTTTSVDLSPAYLEWAWRNLGLNGFTGREHWLEQADVMSWLATDDREYDLIFVDPPTFSNSKRAEDFDVQRDHAGLLRQCAERLAPDGLIVFSTNLRRFRLDADALEGLDVRDVTARSIPVDFARSPRIHHVFDVGHQ